jgi:hypothetical protein
MLNERNIEAVEYLIVHGRITNAGYQRVILQTGAGPT